MTRFLGRRSNYLEPSRNSSPQVVPLAYLNDSCLYSGYLQTFGPRNGNVTEAAIVSIVQPVEAKINDRRRICRIYCQKLRDYRRNHAGDPRVLLENSADQPIAAPHLLHPA